MCDTLICSAASVDSRSRRGESDGKPSASAKPPRSAASSSSGGLIVSSGFPCQDITTASHKGLGLRGTKSSLGLLLIGSLSRTHLSAGKHGCPNCGASYGSDDMPACRFECEPRDSGRLTTGRGSSLLPTPTETANHCAPSMRKWPGYARLQDSGGISPTRWEWMMGYPQGWTDCTRSVTLSSHSAPSSSLEQLPL